MVQSRVTSRKHMFSYYIIKFKYQAILPYIFINVYIMYNNKLYIQLYFGSVVSVCVSTCSTIVCVILR